MVFDIEKPLSLHILTIKRIKDDFFSIIIDEYRVIFLINYYMSVTIDMSCKTNYLKSRWYMINGIIFLCPEQNIVTCLTLIIIKSGDFIRSKIIFYEFCPFFRISCIQTILSYDKAPWIIVKDKCFFYRTASKFDCVLNIDDFLIPFSDTNTCLPADNFNVS